MAPSANRSGHVSPTTAAHVLADLGGRIDLIVDGGATPVGVESTIVACLAQPFGEPALLRPGGVPREAIEAVLGQLARRCAAAVAQAKLRRARRACSPSHYAPRTPLRLEATAVAPGEALLAFGPVLAEGAAGAVKVLNLSARGDPIEAAANLFSHLRALDAAGATTIAVMPIPHDGLGEAINDRLRRAAAGEGDCDEASLSIPPTRSARAPPGGRSREGHGVTSQIQMPSLTFPPRGREYHRSPNRFLARRADFLQRRARRSAEISQSCGGQKLCASYALVLTPPDGWVVDAKATGENKVQIMVPKGQSFATAEPLIYVQVFYQPDKQQTLADFARVEQCALARRQCQGEDHRAAGGRAQQTASRPSLRFAFENPGKAQQAYEVGALGIDSDKDGNDFVLDVVMSGNSKEALDRADAAYTAFLKAH